MNLLEIIGLALVALVVYLIVTHKINLQSLKDKLEGIVNQLHQVHGAAIASATAKPVTPAATPPVVDVAAIAAAIQAAKPAPAPLTVTDPGSGGAGGGPGGAPVVIDNGADNPGLRAYLADGSGNGVPAVGGPGPRTRDDVSTVLEVDGKHYGFPVGTKPYTMPVEAGRRYMLTTSDGYQPITVTVTRSDGSVLGSNSNVAGTAYVRFDAPVTEIVNVTVAALQDGVIERHFSG